MRAWSRNLATIVVVAAMLAACSGDDATTEVGNGNGGEGGPTSGAATLTMAGLAFEPSTVTVVAGDALTLRNEDTATHTFTMDDGSIDVTLDPGQQMEVTPASGGGFHCEIHPSMTGTVNVS